MAISCPHCRQLLLVAERGGFRMSACKHCGGIWLDAAAAHRITTTLDPQMTSLADAASAMAETPFPELAQRPACPVCAQPLTRYRVDVVSVEVDFCAAHGTWFDRDELQTVARALASSRTRPPPTTPTQHPTSVPATSGGSSDWAGPSAGDVAGSVALGGAELAIDVLFSFL